MRHLQPQPASRPETMIEIEARRALGVVSCYPTTRIERLSKSRALARRVARAAGFLALALSTQMLAAPSELSRALWEAAPDLNPMVLEEATEALSCAHSQGVGNRSSVLTVIDYSLPSSERRLWVFDTAEKKLLFRERVAHGVNTGENFARHFSNRLGSRQTSLGLFLTAETYVGRNGYSLKLDGLEQGINDLARERTIVMHGAWYAKPDFLREHGRLGRSWGCPALDPAVARELIDTIQGGSLLFAHYPE